MQYDPLQKLPHLTNNFNQNFLFNMKPFNGLDPGRPSAGGPRVDRRAVTSLGVVKISRLASRLQRSARRGLEPKSVLIGLI